MEYPRQVDGPLRNAQLHQKVAQLAHNGACTKQAKLTILALHASNKQFKQEYTRSVINNSVINNSVNSQ